MTFNDLPLFSNKTNTTEASTAPARSQAPVSKRTGAKSERSAPKLTTPKPVTVSELNSKVSRMLGQEFGKVLVRGEISGAKLAPSGHLYFTLKDQNSTISAAAFSWGRKRRSFQVRDGLEVLVTGQVTLYSARGQYQLVAEKIEPLGQGALQAKFEELKQRLAKEGLFAPENKKVIPDRIRRLAVITSPTGAAVRDVIEVLFRRTQMIEVCIVPALVQGQGAAATLVEGLKTVEREGLGEAILLTRGGGSLEDLFSFNDEELARAIFDCDLPVVSAVGHEVDFSIADFVADLRAPTPSAAAEVLSEGWMGIHEGLRETERRLFEGVLAKHRHASERLEAMSRRLVSPKDRVRDGFQRLDELNQRMLRSWNQILDSRKETLRLRSRHLHSLSPLNVLERGYTIVRKYGDEPHTYQSSKDIAPGQKVVIQFKDGERTGTVD